MDPKTVSAEEVSSSSQENLPQPEVPLEVLQRRRINFMFLGVLKLLMDYIDGKDMLQLRLVSSNWKESVDHLLEHGPFYKGDENDAPSTSSAAAAKAKEGKKVDPQHAIFEQTMVTFTTAQQIVNFMASMGINNDDEAPSKNPFPGRSVRFSPENNAGQILDIIKYEIQMRRLVKMTGNQIWRFRYKMTIVENGTQVAGRNMLIRLLKNMPNLKTLHLDDGSHWLNSEIIEDLQLIWDLGEGPDAKVMEEWLRMAAEGMDGPEPFPTLPNLAEIIYPSRSLYHTECLKTILDAYKNQVKSEQRESDVAVCIAFTDIIDQVMRETADVLTMK